MNKKMEPFCFFLCLGVVKKWHHENVWLRETKSSCAILILWMFGLVLWATHEDQQERTYEQEQKKKLRCHKFASAVSIITLISTYPPTDIDSQWNGRDEEAPNTDCIQTAQTSGKTSNGAEDSCKKTSSTRSTASRYYRSWHWRTIAPSVATSWSSISRTVDTTWSSNTGYIGCSWSRNAAWSL